MNKYFLKRTISLLLTIVLLYSTSIFVFNVSAKNNNDTSHSIINKKMSQELCDAINTSNDSNEFYVWIWFNVNKLSDDVINDLVKKSTGMSYGDISIKYYSDNDFSDFRNQLIDEESMKMYVSSIKSKILAEKVNVKKFLSSKREILSSYYNSLNYNIMDELEISEDKISFVSTMTPSLIAKLSKSEIFRLSKSKFVSNIYLYDLTYSKEPICENQQKTMRVNNVKQQYALTVMA